MDEINAGSSCDIFVATPYAASCDSDGESPDHAYLVKLCTWLEHYGFTVYAAPRNEAWGLQRPPRHVGIHRDYAALRVCSTVIALVGSHVADGVLVEIGLAVALGRRLYLLRTGLLHWPPYLDGLVAGGYAVSIEVTSEAQVAGVAASVAREARERRV